MFPRFWLCALILAGCGNALEERLTGEWVFDKEAARSMNADEPEKDVRDLATTSLELRFTPDGRAYLDVTMGGSKVRAGSGAPYRAVAREGGGFVIETERPDGGVDRFDAAFEGETLFVWFGKRKRPFRRKES